MTAPARPGTDAGWQPGFSEYLLGGIMVLFLFGLLVAAFLYLLPPRATCSSPSCNPRIASPRSAAFRSTPAAW